MVLLVASLQAAYVVNFIHKSSCVVEGQRYFYLFDDALIWMRYANNGAQGYELGLESRRTRRGLYEFRLELHDGPSAMRCYC